MSDEWDGKVVMSTPNGPIVQVSLGEVLARKDAEIEKLRAENKRLRADRRERIATAVLQGLLSNSARRGSPWEAAKVAIEHADFLIAKLDEEDTP